MELKSSAFAATAMMPQQYTCDGQNISPPLAWTGVPDHTQSFAIICDDPEAPIGTWVHWVIFNLPAALRELPEHIPAQKKLPNGAKQGVNDFRQIGYGGPCPSAGEHLYYFKLYALDTRLDLKAGATKTKLLQAMAGHILAESILAGMYKRN